MLLRLMTTCLLAAGLAGCGHLVNSRDAYPVYGNPVNPTPVSGYRVVCYTAPGIDFLQFPVFFAGCQQVIVSRAVVTPYKVVIQTKG